MKRYNFNPEKYGYASITRFNQSEQLRESFLENANPMLYRKFPNYVPEMRLDKGLSEIQILTDRVKDLETRLEVFENNTICIDGYKTISDEDAEKEIDSFLRELRDSGNSDFTVLDLIGNLNISPDQVDRVLNAMFRRKNE